MRRLLHAVAIPLYTLILGSLATLTLLVVPGGDGLAWFARPWARLIAWTCRTQVRARGLDRIPAGRPCIYMSNHQSHFDVVALLITLPVGYRILAKRSLFWIPVFGWALWLAGMIPVDRSRRDRSIASLDRAADKVRRGRSILIFAEGTRSPDGRLQPLKKGGFHLALRAGAPIVPVSIRGSREVLAKGSLDIRPGTIDIVFGEPVEPAGEGPEAIDRLLERVRAAIEAGLRAPAPTVG